MFMLIEQILCAWLLVWGVTAVKDESTSKKIYLLLGESGVGKSSLVNMMHNGNEIAKEGVSYNSETLEVTEYSIIGEKNMSFIDTPGLFDTNGFTNSEICTLIETSLMSKSYQSIDGILIVIDPLPTRIQLLPVLEVLLKIFDSRSLENTIVVTNKIENKAFKQEKVKAFVQASMKPIYDNYGIKFELNNHLIFLDTKHNISKYKEQLYSFLNKMNKEKTKILKIKAFNDKIDSFYQKELNNDENYQTKIDEIAHNEQKIRKVKSTKEEPYTYHCNRRKVCDRFLFWRHDCHTVHDTCVGTKTVDVWLDEPYIDTWIEKKQRRELKYTHEYLIEKSKMQMNQQIKEKIYNDWHQRQESLQCQS